MQRLKARVSVFAGSLLTSFSMGSTISGETMTQALPDRSPNPEAMLMVKCPTRSACVQPAIRELVDEREKKKRKMVSCEEALLDPAKSEGGCGTRS